MSSTSKRDYDAPEMFRHEMRARFLAEARARYGPRVRPASWFGLAVSAVAAAAVIAAALAPVSGPATDPAPSSAPAVETARVSTTGEAHVVAAAGARWSWTAPREIALDAGRIYLDVEPGDAPFIVRHPLGTATAHGTRLLVSAEDGAVKVDVGSGDVSLETAGGAVALGPGEEGIARAGEAPEKGVARRLSYLAGFIGETLELTGLPPEGGSEGWVPGVARIPNAQGEFPLVVTRYHLDVHIENGMARTTIDQAFYNPSWSRVEGTFLFPLPPDASISRLAMYVNGTLMEGGMSERSHAVGTYEKIVRKMQDPALLEWMEGSTFRLRVFPIEANAERRIILSYQQPLESLYESDRYRFPIQKPASAWEEFSIHVLVKGGGAEGWEVASPTYALGRVAQAAGDVELSFEEKGARPAKDLILEVKRPRRPAIDVASHESDGVRFFAATVAPGVEGSAHRGPRRALVVADRSGNASEAERAAQERLAKEILTALDRKDEIAVLAYSTDPRLWRDDFVRRTRANLRSALRFLEGEAFLGAGDVARALREAKDLFGEPRDGDIIFYLGDGLDTMSGEPAEKIAAILPPGIRVLAIPVNRSFDRTLLSSLARRSGGRLIPVSPDDRIAWRAFDIVSSLRTPEWKDLAWKLLDGDGKPVGGSFHADRLNLRDGEVLRIAGKVDGEWPRRLRLQGRDHALPDPRAGCAWIPRLWAKLRIEALEEDSANTHREEIVELGKQYYVMTPFTALLVLENDAMYEQYKIDRGRKDHWALYPAPQQWHGRTGAPAAPAPIFWQWFGETGGMPTTWNRSFQWGFDRGASWNVNGNFWGDVPWTAYAPPVYTPFILADGNEANDLLLLPGTGIDIGSGLGRPEVLKQLLALYTPGGTNAGQPTPEPFGFPDAIFWRRPLADFDGDGILLPYLYARDFSWNEFLESGIPTWTLGWGIDLGLPAFRLHAGGGGGGGDSLPAVRRETRILEEAVASGTDISIDLGGPRLVLFPSGERLLIEPACAHFLDPSAGYVLDRLFDMLVLDTRAPWARAPWFLLPVDFFTAGASVAERTEGDRTIVTIDGGGLTYTEIVFEGKRPVELRAVLRDGLVLQRVAYEAWEEIGGRQIPSKGTILGPTGDAIGSFAYRCDKPSDDDRKLLERIKAARGGTPDAHVVPVEIFQGLAFYRDGDRQALETYLKSVEANGRAGAEIRKLARLAAIRWGTDACIQAPALDPRSPEVRRWLPAEREFDAFSVERALQEGDVMAVRAAVFSGDDPSTWIDALERARPKAPHGLRGLVDLLIGEAASQKGWSLKAYEALGRAAEWAPIAGSISLQDRLCELALGLNEPAKALAHAERAMEILGSAKGADLAPRFERLAEIAGKTPELWRERGRSILERWTRAAPRDPRPFARLADLHREAGDAGLAIRCATQEVEVAGTAETYGKLAAYFESAGDAERAAACRTIAERLTN
ncbi:MAG: FecR domain-containing protein [Planctomycetes bacterium]|nr:FecR domain-containing protein [Planctomycetota bacterium]